MITLKNSLLLQIGIWHVSWRPLRPCKSSNSRCNSSNGRKIKRTAPILTILRRTWSWWPDLFFWKMARHGKMLRAAEKVLQWTNARANEQTNRAVHHDPRTPYRSNRTQYRTDQTENHKNLQTAEKSRGWLGFWRFLNQTNHLVAIYFLKKFQTNESNEKSRNS